MTPFLNAPGTIFDVRSPGEYQKGHIPQALNLPLFTDEERAIVGTTYKHSGPEHAFEQGLRFVEPKLENIIDQVKQENECAKIYCARGGMRSASVAQLLEAVGISTMILEGGYKTFRNWPLHLFAKPYEVVLLGGLTGSGKTAILHALRDLGEQVLDLEHLASHRGSSYGTLGMAQKQPSTEQFQNKIAIEWTSFDCNRPIWIEDESRLIGTCHIPEMLFSKMSKAPLFCIERPLSERMEKLREDYGNTDPEELICATQRIEKRLGGARIKQVIEWIRTGKLRQAGEAVLEYYDSAYRYSLSKRQQPIHYLQGEDLSSREWAAKLQNTHQSRVLASL